MEIAAKDEFDDHGRSRALLRAIEGHETDSLDPPRRTSSPALRARESDASPPSIDRVSTIERIEPSYPRWNCRSEAFFSCGDDLVRAR